jgi:6-phosphogluconolactonase
VTRTPPAYYDVRVRLALLVVLAACGGDAPAMPSADAARSDAGSDAGEPMHVVAYVSGYGPSIAWFDVDLATGALAAKGSLAAAQPSFLALSATHAYAVSENMDRVGAYAIDPATGALAFIGDQPSQGAGPAHVAIDRSGGYVLVANYGGGTAAVLPIAADGSLGAATQTISPGTNAHMIVTDPSNRFAFVPCKGSDFVAQYTFTHGVLAANAVPHLATAAGAGPRHLAFAPDGAHAYLVDETASTLMVLGYEAATGRLATRQTISTRAAGAMGPNTGAEVAVAPSGKFVYASNRGDDDLAVFAVAADGSVTPASHTPSGGMTPRMFALDPTGRWLYAANQGSNSVVAFAVDAATGALTATGAVTQATMPAFVGFVALP